MNTYILYKDIENTLLSYITKEGQIYNTKSDVALILNEIQSKRKTFKERAYNHIILIILSFTLGYMLSVQMQNDMYKVMNQKIEQCNKK